MPRTATKVADKILCSLAKEGLSPYEISKITGVPRNSIKYRLINLGVKIVTKAVWVKYKYPHPCEICGKLVSKHRFCSTICRTKFRQSDKKYKSMQDTYMRRRNKVRADSRERIIVMAGGSCIKCGYDRNYAALQFHHRNEKTKLFPINSKNCVSHSLESIKKELRKCDLLCTNCHTEAHNKDKFTNK